jgi:hypothetical protein
LDFADIKQAVESMSAKVSLFSRRLTHITTPKLLGLLVGSLLCACPAKMNQHLVYQRIDLDLFVKGVTTRGKFVERGDCHYRVLAEAAECVL